MSETLLGFVYVRNRNFRVLSISVTLLWLIMTFYCVLMCRYKTADLPLKTMSPREFCSKSVM